MTVWKWTVFELMVTAAMIREMKEVESDIYEQALDPAVDISGV